MPWAKSSIFSAASLTDIVGMAPSCGSPRSTIRRWCGQSFKFDFSDFCFFVDTCHGYLEAATFKPFLGSPHKAYDFANAHIGEVRVGKGSGFTPPPTWARSQRVCARFSAMQALQVAALTSPLVRRKSVHGSSRPQTLQILVSISGYIF